MAGKFPYVPSAGPLLSAVNQFRKSFPNEITAETLKKLGIAPKNESFVISTLRYLKLIDDKGKKSAVAAKVFLNHDEAKFEKEFGELVKSAYHELFELHGDAAWGLSKPALIQFFRTSDQSSELVGTRQTVTFQCLAALSGHAEMPQSKGTSKPAKAPRSSKKSEAPLQRAAPKPAADSRGSASGSRAFDGKQGAIGMTVRIEVNLPSGADQDTYDAIFKSIRKNLIDA